MEIRALSTPRVLLVDLNNFARYPSVAIGYLSAILKKGGYAVCLLYTSDAADE